jgi:exosortase
MESTIKITDKRIHGIFLLCCAAMILVNFGFFRQLSDYSSTHEFASHIFLIPVISAFLIFRKREMIFAETHASPAVGIPVCVLAAVAFFATGSISVKTAAVVALLIGLFVAFYGAGAFKKSMFPLLFLILMVPIPESCLDHVIVFLQRGSAEVVALLFTLTGTPYHREGVTFALPKVTIEIATQCSGIRSTIALLLSCLLAAHLILVKPSRQLLFVLIAIPMALFKNALRIATLSILAIHVDIGFIGGSDLHQKGGILFFITTLLVMTPVLWLLRRSEKA